MQMDAQRGAQRAAVSARICAILAVAMIAALVIGEVGKPHLPALEAFDWVAAVAAVLLAAIRIGHVQRLARIFAVLAAIVAAAVLLVAPEARPVVGRALMQGTAFSAFLTALGLIRAPVRASKVIGLAAAWLFACPARMRSAAMTYGAQFLAVLFNLGVIAMMHDIARDHSDRARAEGRSGVDAGAVTLVVERGALLATIWNPIGVGFAIVTAAIPALDPALFLMLSFVVAMVVSAGSLVFAPRDDQADPESRAPEGGARALLIVLAVVAGLIAVTLVLHRLLGVGFLTAACIVLPLLSVLWSRVEPSVRGPKGGALDGLAQATASMASESTIFLAATMIGAGASLALGAIGIEALISGGMIPPVAVVLGCLELEPLAGAIMIPHSIVMLLVVQLFGAGPVGQAHPQSLALALCLAWAFAIATSPISAMSIVTGRLTGIGPTGIALRVNRAFTLCGLAASALIVLAVYLLE